MDRPLVSIITPAYNCAETILDTYLSIKKQTYSNWEWVITEDCSTDETFEIISNIVRKDSRVKLYQNIKNSGAAVSRNNAISQAIGDYLAFIDSDDIWKVNKLKSQIEFMQSKSVSFCFTAYELIDIEGKSLNKTVDTHISMPLSYSDMLKKKATLGCSTVMLRVAEFTDISMPLIRTGQDYGLWLKLLRTGINATPLPIILTEYRIMPNSISRNKVKKASRQWEIYRKIEGLSLFYSMWCFAFYAWRAVFRK